MLFILSVDEIRQAARILFDSAVTRLSDEESSILAEKLQHHCKTFLPEVARLLNILSSA